MFRNNLYFGITPHESDVSAKTADPAFYRPGTAGTDIDLKTMGALRGYGLRPGSPCIDAGIAIHDHGGIDLLGSELPPGTAHIGALGRRP